MRKIDHMWTVLVQDEDCIKKDQISIPNGGHGLPELPTWSRNTAREAARFLRAEGSFTRVRVVRLNFKDPFPG